MWFWTDWKSPSGGLVPLGLSGRGLWSVRKGHALLPLSLGLFYVAPGTAYLGAEPHICVQHGAPPSHKSPAEDLWKNSSNI